MLVIQLAIQSNSEKLRTSANLELDQQEHIVQFMTKMQDGLKRILKMWFLRILERLGVKNTMFL